MDTPETDGHHLLFPIVLNSGTNEIYRCDRILMNLHIAVSLDGVRGLFTTARFIRMTNKYH